MKWPPEQVILKPRWLSLYSFFSYQAELYNCYWHQCVQPETPTDVDGDIYRIISLRFEWADCEDFFFSSLQLCPTQSPTVNRFSWGSWFLTQRSSRASPVCRFANCTQKWPYKAKSVINQTILLLFCHFKYHTERKGWLKARLRLKISKDGLKGIFKTFNRPWVIKWIWHGSGFHCSKYLNYSHKWANLKGS